MEDKSNALKRKQTYRQKIPLSMDTSIVEESLMFPDCGLMLKVSPRVSGTSLASWLRANSDYLKAKLHIHGALLFRGFVLNDDDDFLGVTASLPFERIDASNFEESTPREKIKDGVYTATLFPSQEEIFLHSDYSPSKSFAGKLCFFCLVPPDSAGETPFADTRSILNDLDPAIRNEFERKGWRLVRNFRPELGLSWRDTFFGKSQEQIEKHCSENEIDLQWIDGYPRISQTRRAIEIHHITGEAAWFNHIAFWHIANLPDPVRETMLREVGIDWMPFNTFFGDGSAIPDEVAKHIHDVQLAHKRKFAWQQGDLVVADNILTCHGREPYKGKRTIRVSLLEPLMRPSFTPN